MADPLATAGLPWTPEDTTFWTQEITRARDKRTKLLEKWDAKGNLESYAKSNVKDDRDINTNKDFSDVERKKAALFYDLPEVALIPDVEETPSEALLLHQEFLNSVLGPRYMNAKATVLQTEQDALVVIQPALSEIGYLSVTETVQPPAMPGSVLGLRTPVTVPVYERFFWAHLSPRATLLPSDFRSTDYDDAPWIGYDWRKPLSQVRRWLQMPPDWTPASSDALGRDDKPYFDHGVDDEARTEPMVTGSCIFFRAYLRDATVSHPLVCRQFVWIDGEDEPFEYKTCPYTTIGPDGRLTPDSMPGFQVHPLALRDLTDSAYVQADLTVVSPLTRELNKFRTQMLQRRDGSRNHVLYDTGIVDEDMRAKIERNQAPMMIGVEAGKLAQGKDSIMAQVPTLNLGRESYIGQDIIERDRMGVFGIRPNGVGVEDGKDQTATEASLAQRNMDARFEQEHQRVLAWFLLGCQKVSALLLKYGDRMALEVLGPKKGPMWIQAKQAGMFTRFRFALVMNSGAYIDTNERMRQVVQIYNMTAKDPQTNRSEVLREMATLAGLNPAKWIVTQPPEKQPDPAAISFSCKPEDLNPFLPSYAATYQILTAAGVKNLPPPQVDPNTMPPITPELAGVDGLAEKAPRLNQEQMDLTGAMSGPGPM